MMTTKMMLVVELVGSELVNLPCKLVQEIPELLLALNEHDPTLS